MKNPQKSTSNNRRARAATGLVACMTLLATTFLSPAAVVVTFGETVPVSNIIDFYEPTSTDQLAWLRDDDTNRVVGQSFGTPLGGPFLISGITMKLQVTIAQDFASPSGFSIDVYELSAPGENPASGILVAGYTGTMQTTTSVAVAGSYFTFNLPAPLQVESDSYYGFVLGFEAPEDYNILRMTVSDGDADPGGLRAWLNTNGGGWNSSGETYAFYIQGTVIPEPGALGLLAVGGLLFGLRRRRVGKSRA